MEEVHSGTIRITKSFQLVKIHELRRSLSRRETFRRTPSGT